MNPVDGLEVANSVINQVTRELRDVEVDLRKRADACDQQFGEGAGAALKAQADAIDAAIRKHIIPVSSRVIEHETQPRPNPVVQVRSRYASPRIHGETARIIICNAARMSKEHFQRKQLWAFVADLTGHGSGYSQEICRSANLDPFQVNSIPPLKALCSTPE